MCAFLKFRFFHFSSALLSSHEIPCIILCSALGSPKQEGCGAVGANPGEDHENCQRGGAPLIGKLAETLGAVQPGEENVPGRPCRTLQYPTGSLQESWRGTFDNGL